MGMLVEGKWKDVWYDTGKSGGSFERSQSAFRNWVTVDGSAGPSGDNGFKAEQDRYHLYVSYACPWAHRTLIFRKLKKLEELISVSVVHYFMGENGWEFRPEDGATKDHINGKGTVWQLYAEAMPDYSGRATVPILWDKKQHTIVSNESADIIRMLNSAFDEWADETPDFYPEALSGEIDSINERIYHTVNNGVYKAGFATTQSAYEKPVAELFETLDLLEQRLSARRYLVGDFPTEADWRLFTTLLRFDPVYFGHFKCNVRRLVDYPNLWAYTRDLYQTPGVSETVHMDHIKNHYYQSHETVNPTRIVPVGPYIDFGEPHGRGTL